MYAEGVERYCLAGYDQRQLLEGIGIIKQAADLGCAQACFHYATLKMICNKYDISKTDNRRENEMDRMREWRIYNTKASNMGHDLADVNERWYRNVIDGNESKTRFLNALGTPQKAIFVPSA